MIIMFVIKTIRIIVIMMDYNQIRLILKNRNPVKTESHPNWPVFKLIFALNCWLNFELNISDDNYLHFPPSRYIFKGAEVYNSDLKPHSNRGDLSDDDNSNSSLSGSSLSTPSSSSSSSSSSLSTSDSSLLPTSYSKAESDEIDSKTCSFRPSPGSSSNSEYNSSKT